MRKAGPFVAGTLGMGLLLAGEGDVASSETARTGAAVLVLDGVAIAVARRKENRKRREVTERSMSTERSLPPFRKDRVLGMELLQAYVDVAAQQRREARRELPSNDPCVYLQALIDRLTKYVPEDVRFNVAVDGIRTELIKNYNATYLIHSSDPERPDLQQVCAQLDHHLPIDPHGVPTVQHATWFDYIRDQATQPYKYPNDGENIVAQVPSALAEALGRHASEAS